MRQSQLFTKTRKESPKDEVSKNAQLLIRGGFVHKEMAGVYTYLPLGLMVLNKIVQIIREEMNAVGGQELLMSALQDKALWESTDRWDDKKVDNWFKTKLASGGEAGLGITHEEPLTRIMTDHISSYRDLPVVAYQFQNKFRNELRAKSGIMRGKEFLMKDMYSFSKDTVEHEAVYARVREAYVRVFNRLGLGDRTYITFADGGIFSPFSEEFQTVSDAGEDTIYVHTEKGLAFNKEVYTDENLKKFGVTKAEMVEKKAIEVGNIFHLGTRFSDALGLTYRTESGETLPVVMGCYGIGPSRVMGTIVETFSDEKGIVWPEAVAPFSVHLVRLGGSDEVIKSADELEKKLLAKNVSVLYDDREASAGEKFADSDLLGLPYRVVVSDKTVAAGKWELKRRASGEVEHLSTEELLNLFK